MADFGLSRKLAVPARSMTKEVSTLWYRAPEVLLDNLCYTHAMDMWSVGTIIYEMLFGHVMFKGISEIEQILTIFRTKGTPTRESMKSYDKCPVLLKIGEKLPKFHIKDSAGSEDSVFEFSTLKQSNIFDGIMALVDSLTALEPTERPSARLALETLCQLELRLEREINAGGACYEEDQV